MSAFDPKRTSTGVAVRRLKLIQPLPKHSVKPLRCRLLSRNGYEVAGFCRCPEAQQAIVKVPRILYRRYGLETYVGTQAN